MKEYLISGRDTDGSSVTEIVEAESGDAAFQAFSDDGHTDVVLHTSEFTALLYKPSAMRALLRPDEMVDVRGMTSGQWAARFTRKLYRKLWFLIAIPAAVAIFWWLFDDSFGFWAALTGFTTLVPGGFALFIHFSPGARAYRKLLTAIGWGQWEQALALIPRARTRLPAYELTLRRAQALAGLGRLEEAEEVYDQLDGNPAYPRPVFWGFLALVYVAGGEREKAVTALERAHELAPENPDILIDLASVMVNFRGDIGRARRLLDEADRHILADTTQPFYRTARGVIALAENRPAVAVEHLHWAVRHIEPFLNGNPSLRYHIARIQSHLALALAAEGDQEAAQHEAEQTRAVLQAHQDDMMLDRLAKAIG